MRATPSEGYLNQAKRHQRVASGRLERHSARGPSCGADDNQRFGRRAGAPRLAVRTLTPAAVAATAALTGGPAESRAGADTPAGPLRPQCQAG